jgi:hypothetical protein
MEYITHFFSQIGSVIAQFWTYVQDHQDMAIVWCVALVAGLIVMKLVSKVGGILLKLLLIVLVAGWGVDSIAMIWDFVQKKFSGQI